MWPMEGQQPLKRHLWVRAAARPHVERIDPTAVRALSVLEITICPTPSCHSTWFVCSQFGMFINSFDHPKWLLVVLHVFASGVLESS